MNKGGVMLTLTEGATEAIKGLVGDHPGAGLRIFPGQSDSHEQSDSQELQFGLSISESPEPNDEVVEQSGCQVFLDEAVAPLVDGRTLDAAPVEEGGCSSPSSARRPGGWSA
jgi:Fe-S cluster assembly iron-binding protein IscA